jgi:osmotically inducible lipoprotein OsmB
MHGTRRFIHGKKAWMASLRGMRRPFTTFIHFLKEINMNGIKKYSAICALAAMGLAGCSGMTTQERNTAIGAGVGGVAGSALTGGSTAGTLGGAAVGGVIGHEVTKPKR